VCEIMQKIPASAGGAKSAMVAHARADIVDFFEKWRRGTADFNMLGLVARKAVTMLVLSDSGSGGKVRIVPPEEINKDPSAFRNPPFSENSKVVNGWSYTPPPGRPLEEQEKVNAAVEHVRKLNGEREPMKFF